MYFRPPYGKGLGVDVEAADGAPTFYPMMLENPELRWAFIRKVYSILAIQMLLTVVVASIVVFNRSVAVFFVSTPGGVGLYIFLLILPFVGMVLVYYCSI
jgi:protein lifeguard